MMINDSLKQNLGGKAYKLRLLEKFCEVPTFFTLSFDNIDEINSIEIQKQIIDYFENNKFSLVAVRSSANVEDSKEASFAGMFETVLNVKKEGLIEAIKRVLNSSNGTRVMDYCKVKNIPFENIKMNIVIQEMVDSRVSGVCFTKIKESKDSLLIEACFGLGEALVSSIVTPDSYQISRNTKILEKKIIGYQKTMLKKSSQGTNEYQEIPFHKRNAKKLSNDEIEELIEIVLKIEENLKLEAADIEWAFENDKLYILQARPFTGI